MRKKITTIIEDNPRPTELTEEDLRRWILSQPRTPHVGLDTKANWREIIERWNKSRKSIAKKSK